MLALAQQTSGGITNNWILLAGGLNAAANRDAVVVALLA